MVEQVSGAAGSGILTWIWGRSRSFLFHILMIVLVGLFMRIYVDDRPFFLSHTVNFFQADGNITHEYVLQPVQRDITTIISILASTARAASTLWLGWIDLRCIFLFMQTGGVSSKGLKAMFNKSLPGRGHFQKKMNLIILLGLNLIILAGTYASSVLTGSVAWNPAIIYRPGRRVEKIPLALPGSPIDFAADASLLDSFIAYSTATYSIFYGNPESRESSSMHRLLPDSALYLSNASKFEELTVPFFAVNAFEWIKDPNSTLSPTQMAAATVFNSTGPRLMNLRKFGLIPDGNWGPSELVLPAPHTVAESRILVIMTTPDESNRCHLDPPIPDVQPYMTMSGNLSWCFLFANVTYQAGAARCHQCQVSGTGVIRDAGNVKDLRLIEYPVTSAALAFAPYISTALFDTGYALPRPAYSNSTWYKDFSIEILSRSYQVSWSSLTYIGTGVESSNVSIAVVASKANVLMWRVILWGALHAIIVGFGFGFRYIHTTGNHPWIEDPLTAAFFVDPTPLMGEKRAWAGEDTPGKFRLELAEKEEYIVLQEVKEKEEESEEL